MAVSHYNGVNHGSAPAHAGNAEKRVSQTLEVPMDSTNETRQKVQAVHADFICESHGSVFLLRPVSPAAFSWIEEHLPEDRQTFGNAVAVEARFIWAILEGLQDDGLTVSR